MIMMGLKASDKLLVLTLCITAHAGACQVQAKFSARFKVIYTDFILAIGLHT